MLGGIIFVIVVWFIPLLVWYFVQGRQEFSKEASCVSSAKEVLNSKRAFYGAIIFGLIILASIIIFG